MKIYVWGTGWLAGRCIGDVLQIEDIEGFIDNNENKVSFMGKPVLRPKDVAQKEYDAILVITLYSQEIFLQSQKIGLDKNKMIFLYENYFLSDVNTNYELAEQILGKSYVDRMKNRYILIKKNEYLPMTEAERSKNEYFGTDYIRVKTLELAANQLKEKEIEGNIAEVGVFQGKFAQYMNQFFPEKKCYLFDTFEGFDAREAKNEIKKGHVTQVFVESYKKTNEDMVRSKMPYPHSIVIKKGYFPDSLDGLEDTFAFVSIDVDFEESILSCLQYFYPRTSDGGVIFIHDYNSKLQGVKAAVKRYEKELGYNLKTLPLCDMNGTIVILK